MSYPGGKNGSGVYQTIINQIPPHRVYIEPFMGGAAIMRRKMPAAITIGIDASPDVISLADPITIFGDERSCAFICGDGAGYLQEYDFQGDEFVYCDPPYVLSTRTRELYDHEMTDQQHRELLATIKALPCNVAISGYHSALYLKELSDWRLLTFNAVTRGGTVAREHLWMNYPEPTELHDYQYLGDDFRERERIRKRNSRWLKRLLSLPPLERRALTSELMMAESSLATNGEASGTPDKSFQASCMRNRP